VDLKRLPQYRRAATAGSMLVKRDEGEYVVHSQTSEPAFPLKQGAANVGKP